MAAGEYIAFVDGDDYMDDGWLSSIDSVINNYSPDIIVFAYKSVDQNHNIVNKYKLGIPGGLYTIDKISEEILPGMINQGSFENRSNIYLSRVNKVIKKSLLLQNTRFYLQSISYGEDNLFTIPNVLQADSLFIMENYYPYNYRVNYSSITHSVNKNIWKQFLELDAFTIQILEELNHKEMIGQVYCDAVFHAAVSINNIVRDQLNNRDKIIEIQNVVSHEYVRKGLPHMRPDACSRAEKLNLFLIKNKLVRPILLIKTLQWKMREKK